VVASRSHRDARTESWLSTIDVGELVSAGSSLKFCLLAAGEADLYPRFGRTMEWDTAAGHAVLAAAGGQVATEDGAPLTYGKARPRLRQPGLHRVWGVKVIGETVGRISPGHGA
jgi:3'(2'), 5'-bisphosphate nucleotidase